ncbi:MAG: membrane dipeptidase [Clostridia bacterium]|nr:membrane dipeptidase [Clostridia bacterium]
MKLFDLHCDTPSLLYKRGESIESNALHVSLEKTSCFEKYLQCAAIWSDPALSDGECFEFFKNAAGYFKDQCNGYITDANTLQSSGSGFILTVEDSRLISDIPDGVTRLYDFGVRVLTLVWKGLSAVGGAWDTSEELTKKGKDILEECFSTGIIPDISHASDKAALYTLERGRKTKKPVIATHSNSRTVCHHRRNLPDNIARSVAEGGGIIGISLYPPHLFGERAEICHVIDHISHYRSLLGDGCICLGCDFDGIGITPRELEDISSLPRLYDALSKRFGESFAEGVFYNNAYNFFINNLQREV